MQILGVKQGFSLMEFYECIAWYFLSHLLKTNHCVYFGKWIQLSPAWNKVVMAKSSHSPGTFPMSQQIYLWVNSPITTTCSVCIERKNLGQMYRTEVFKCLWNQCPGYQQHFCVRNWVELCQLSGTWLNIWSWSGPCTKHVFNSRRSCSLDCTWQIRWSKQSFLLET